jgi:hypothetical protein
MDTIYLKTWTFCRLNHVRSTDSHCYLSSAIKMADTCLERSREKAPGSRDLDRHDSSRVETAHRGTRSTEKSSDVISSDFSKLSKCSCEIFIPRNAALYVNGNRNVLDECELRQGIKQHIGLKLSPRQTRGQPYFHSSLINIADEVCSTFTSNRSICLHRWRHLYLHKYRQWFACFFWTKYTIFINRLALNKLISINLTHMYLMGITDFFVHPVLVVPGDEVYCFDNERGYADYLLPVCQQHITGSHLSPQMPQLWKWLG